QEKEKQDAWDHGHGYAGLKRAPVDDSIDARRNIHQHDRLEEEGFIEVLDFDKPARPLVRPIQQSGLSMQHFFDSDFGKWIEDASYTLKANP
ncbi:hypothetical protein AB9F45_36165, partial [Rhizobium leguminosarum]|uniref:hypothetical protein n=1 Tax=Rhizobium leguminosarum TaxID=384 RepID=UPI003F9A7A87